MRVLMVHKFYFIEGGAERYLFNISGLLSRHGIEVIPFAMHHPRNAPTPYARYFISHFDPDRILGRMTLRQGLRSVGRVIYSLEARRNIERLIDDTSPDIAHVHGVYHHLSPSVLLALKRRGIPVVFTLHEYKILCPSYLFLNRRGEICELCQGKEFWHPIKERCLKGSLAASVLVSVEAYVHRFLRTYRRTVDLYLSPSRFLRDKMIQYGFPPDKVIWLPYTIPIDEYVPSYQAGSYFTYVGRLSREKGVELLVEAMEDIPEAELYVCGTGRLEEPLKRFVAARGLRNVRFLGHLASEQLRAVMRGSMFTVVPSIVYDNSPLAVYESFALGKPVVGAHIGGIPELIEPGQDGVLFEPNNRGDMVRAIRALLAERSKLEAMGRKARAKAERWFAPEEHLRRLMVVYRQVGGA
ncbi:MAG: glycosyltransferase family 4 protein [bacterium]|nr:glycosyltransferase family 4 protein [candidate division KSB1 bacterium]MDH7559920.1 glycosyltransferase family 4 protein [bacterium]